MVLILEARSHLDLGDLPNLLAAELGVMTVRLERAIRSLDEVAQVHVNRWGDGAAHLHLWFLGRPAGQLQLRGPFLAMWDEILEPVPEAQWRSNLAHIAAWLEEFGGTAQVAPPRIEWHAPSTFAGIAALADPAVDATLGAGLAADGASVEASDSEVKDASNAHTATPPGPRVATSAGDPGSTGSSADEPGSAADASAANASAANADGDDHISTAKEAENPDWTTVDYDESQAANASAEVTVAEPNRDLASDDDETVSVRIPSQVKRPLEERVGR
jgi:hypothetical protein